MRRIKYFAIFAIGLIFVIFIPVFIPLETSRSIEYEDQLFIPFEIEHSNMLIVDIQPQSKYMNDAVEVYHNSEKHFIKPLPGYGLLSDKKENRINRVFFSLNRLPSIKSDNNDNLAVVGIPENLKVSRIVLHTGERFNFVGYFKNLFNRIGISP